MLLSILYLLLDNFMLFYLNVIDLSIYVVLGCILFTVCLYLHCFMSYLF